MVDSSTRGLSRGAAGMRRSAFLPEGARGFLQRRIREIGGGALIVLAGALLLALLTYNPSDPSWNSAAGGPAGNALGSLGSYPADLFIQTLGLAAFLPPLAFFVWGWQMVRQHPMRQLWQRAIAMPIALLLTALALAPVQAPAAWASATGLGGAVGALLSDQITETLLLRFSVADASWIPLAAAIPAGIAWLVAIGLTWSEWRRLFIRTGHGLGTAGGVAWRFARTWTPVVIRAGRRGVAAVAPLLSRLRLPAVRRTARRDPLMQEDDPALVRRLLGELDEERAVQDRDRGPAAPSLNDEGDRSAKVVAPRPGPLPAGRRVVDERQASLDLAPPGDYELPALDLLGLPDPAKGPQKPDDSALSRNAELLEGVLGDFGVRGQIVRVNPGPVVTLYELEPAPGTKSSRVISLADDIARSMSAVSVRVAVVPGRNVIGIELPNQRRETVYLREILASQAFERATGRLPLVLGKDIGGQPIIADLARMPHLLVAGTTGSGKSVAINTMILSLLYRLPPDRARFIMVDPKMLELSTYNGIPHLLTPVVTDPKQAVVALKWAVREMEDRYRAMAKLGVRNIDGFNQRLRQARESGEALTRRVQVGFDPDTGKPLFEEHALDLTELPFIVLVVDEMADLMLVAGKDIEAAIQRLAQMARAAGIHLIMATQRPSVDVITGTIKANFPTRISFQVTSKIDSRTILGEQGAEQLLGMGDMLYMPGSGRLMRVHGPFVSDSEVESVVRFLRSQGEPNYNDAILEDPDEGAAFDALAAEGGNSGDDLYDQAVALVARERKASTSFIQRHLQIGYNRAARIIERMEAEGMVSAANHVGKREVLLRAPDDD